MALRDGPFTNGPYGHLACECKGGWGTALFTLPARSLVFNNRLITIKGTKLLADDITTISPPWNLNLNDGSNLDYCEGGGERAISYFDFSSLCDISGLKQIRGPTEWMRK